MLAWETMAVNMKRLAWVLFAGAAMATVALGQDSSSAPASGPKQEQATGTETPGPPEHDMSKMNDMSDAKDAKSTKSMAMKCMDTKKEKPSKKGKHGMSCCK